MGPLQIETIAREIAEQYGAQITVVTGEGLLEANYPAVHAVGRAADAGPRAPDDRDQLGRAGARRWSAMVGKGVVFDTGGLDIKPSAGMRLMKKDMGGAAHALALGRMIMAAKLPVRLVVLVPVVENAISGDAMRPGDVLASRKGLSIEVGNTDAEGRLILADALTRAGELEPALTIDLATLTGAARVALGPQLPPFYTDDEALAGRHRGAPPRPRPTRCGACRCGRATPRRWTATWPRSRTTRRLGPGGLGDRGPVPAAVRADQGPWVAPRHLRLEPAQPAGLPGGRRGPGDPRPLPHDPRAVRVSADGTRA